MNACNRNGKQIPHHKNHYHPMRQHRKSSCLLTLPQNRFTINDVVNSVNMLRDNLSNNIDGLQVDNISIPRVHPVVGSRETSLALDTDSVSSEELSEHLSIPNQVLSSGSTVHIENSSDVVIGPLTQFHGPVTIYQNINSEKDLKEKNLTLNDKLEDLNKPTKANTFETKSTKSHQTLSDVLFKTPNKRLFIYSVIIFGTLLTVVLGTILSLKLYAEPNEREKEIEKETTITFAPLTTHKIYDRGDWGGRPSKNFTKLLAHPVEYVLISHTAGRFCKTFLECSSVMQQIQSMHVSANSPDIGYNFLIGGDGSVYVGRGWDIINFHQNNTIGVSFIGNYVFDELVPEMISALQDLLGAGVKLNKLSSDYKIVCHNQTFATLSPGQNVYSQVSRLPHFYGGRV